MFTALPTSAIVMPASSLPLHEDPTTRHGEIFWIRFEEVTGDQQGLLANAGGRGDHRPTSDNRLPTGPRQHGRTEDRVPGHDAHLFDRHPERVGREG
jgi:hypothetical protein